MTCLLSIRLDVNRIKGIDQALLLCMQGIFISNWKPDSLHGMLYNYTEQSMQH